MYKVSANKSAEELCLMIPKSHSVPPTKFSKRGGLDRTSTVRGGLLGKMEMTFFRGSCNFYVKNKLKSEIFNNKKSL